MSKTIYLTLKYPCYACYHNDIHEDYEPCSVCKWLNDEGVSKKLKNPTDESVYREDKFELIKNPSGVSFGDYGLENE